jgi:hypothetical protein
MNEQRTPKPSPLAGEGAEAGEGAVATNPSPGRSPSAGALRRPADARPPSPARGEGNEPAARDVVPSKPVSLARGLRSRMTDAERKLWFALRVDVLQTSSFDAKCRLAPTWRISCALTAGLSSRLMVVSTPAQLAMNGVIAGSPRITF